MDIILSSYEVMPATVVCVSVCAGVLAARILKVREEEEAEEEEDCEYE